MPQDIFNKLSAKWISLTKTMEKDDVKCDVPYVEKGDPADTRLRMWAHFLLLLSRFSSNLILKCKDEVSYLFD